MRCHHRDGPYHDCAYVEARNALVPLADKRVCEALGSEPTWNAIWRQQYNEMFHAEMCRLWRIREMRAALEATR